MRLATTRPVRSPKKSQHGQQYDSDALQEIVGEIGDRFLYLKVLGSHSVEGYAQRQPRLMESYQLVDLLTQLDDVGPFAERH